MSTDKFFLGLDCSTQSLKAVLIDDHMDVVASAAVNFDRDLPDFSTVNGVHQHPDGLTVTAPPLMWAAALDLVLERLLAQGAPLGQVAAVSGSGQQHGSVWLRQGAAAVLRGLDPKQTLRAQLRGVFTLDESPIWMDASTSAYCAMLERKLGGAQKLAELTGSRAYERFTGNQIAKVFAESRAAYDATERVALVSSFLAGLLIGDYAPIDFSDGSGMNLLDIRAKRWAPEALVAVADGQWAAKLGEPVPAHAALGRVHDYFVRKYGFTSNCAVVAFSGDNPCSLAGLRLSRPGAAALSLGTSDTFFGATLQPAPSGDEGHVFVSPIDPEAYMVMLVRKNGSLARERVRDLFADGDWQIFNSALDATPPGNDGCIGFYQFAPEITPPLKKTGIFRFNAEGRTVAAFKPAQECRAVVESQFLCLRAHAAARGLMPAAILITGGASVNRAIVQIAADVFNVPVLGGAYPDSAALGAAYRARHAWLCQREKKFLPFDEAVLGAPPFQTLAAPRAPAVAQYAALAARYVRLEMDLCHGACA